MLPSDIHAPRIKGFNPHSGPVTSLVTVTGEHFIANEKVKIGKLSVGWNRLSGCRLGFRVPTKSKGGRILVRTADGSDTSGTGFNVRKDMHKSTITFSLSGHLVGSGTVRSRDNDGVCRTQRHVVVQRRYGGGWHGVRNDRTSPNGTYHVSVTDTEGVYRAVVGSKSTLKDRCSGANSDARKHHHADAGGGGGEGCTAGYSPCLPLGPSDYDCYGGGGDGPAYTEPGVTYDVTGSNPYGLDADNDGRGCEPDPHRWGENMFHCVLSTRPMRFGLARPARCPGPEVTKERRQRTMKRALAALAICKGDVAGGVVKWPGQLHRLPWGRELNEGEAR